MTEYSTVWGFFFLGQKILPPLCGFRIVLKLLTDLRGRIGENQSGESSTRDDRRRYSVQKAGGSKGLRNRLFFRFISTSSSQTVKTAQPHGHRSLSGSSGSDVFSSRPETFFFLRFSNFLMARIKCSASGYPVTLTTTCLMTNR